MAELLPSIVLASGSTRRRELLASLGLPFEVVPPLVDEKSVDVTGLGPREKVLKLAVVKGQDVAERYPDALVIAADTLVAIDGKILEKPVDRDDAFRMLSTLQGNEHSVFSSIAVFYQGRKVVDSLETKVQMRPLTDEAIWRYVDTGEPMDKAGSYAIQGYGSLLVESIEGCYFNVVGMSLVLLDQLCKSEKIGITLVL
jgi:septum formation protein